MKILGICLVKNEVDIICYTLNEATKWADKIFVYDNGSTDGTWEAVIELSKTNEVIIPYKSESKPFRDGLRAEVFNAYKHLAKDGDWWCVRLDSDEFYIDNPKEFLAKISKFHQVVTSLHYEYYLTLEDLKTIDFSESTEKVISQIRYYHPKVTSETRFIRHRDKLIWPKGCTYPVHKGVISPKKIRLRHYQYRSPHQIKTRIEIRKKAISDGHKYFRKDNVDSWEALILSQSDLIRESNDMEIGWIKDPNKVPWYYYMYLYVMHNLKIYP